MISGINEPTCSRHIQSSSDYGNSSGNTLEKEVTLTRTYIDSLDERANGGTHAQNMQYLSGDTTPKELADFLLLFTGTEEVPAVQHAYNNFIDNPTAENLATLRTEVETHVTHYGVNGVPDLSTLEQAYDTFIDDPTGENLSELQEAGDMKDQVDSMTDYMHNVRSRNYGFKRERDTFSKIMDFLSPEPMDKIEQAGLMVKFAYCETNPKVQQALAHFKADPSPESLESLIALTKANEKFDGRPPVNTADASSDDPNNSTHNDQSKVSYNNATLPPIGYTLYLDPAEESEEPPSVDVVTHLPGKGFVGDDGKVYTFEHDDDEWKVNSDITYDSAKHLFKEGDEKFILFNGAAVTIDSVSENQPRVKAGNDFYVFTTTDGWKIDDFVTSKIFQDTWKGSGEFIMIGWHRLNVDARIPDGNGTPRVLVNEKIYTFNNGWRQTSNITLNSDINIYSDSASNEAFIKVGDSWKLIGGQHPGSSGQPKVNIGEVIYKFDEKNGWTEDTGFSFDPAKNTFQSKTSDDLYIAVNNAYLPTDVLFQGRTGEQPKALIGDSVYTFDAINGWIEDRGLTFDSASNIFQDTDTEEALILAGETLISINHLAPSEDEDSSSRAIAGNAVYNFDETTGWRIDPDLTFDPVTNIFKNSDDEQFILVDDEYVEITSIKPVNGSTQPSVNINIHDTYSLTYHFDKSEGWWLDVDDLDP